MELKFKAKCSKLILNCESSEAKQTCLKVKNLFRSEANLFKLRNLNIEAKQSKLIINFEYSDVKQKSYFQKPN
jgi:hypothetical protein